VLARGSVAKGLLLGKPAVPYLNYAAGEVAAAAAAISKISGRERDVAQTALRFVLQQPAVSSAIVGIRTGAQLEDALRVAHTPVLQEDEMTQLKQAIVINKYDQHR